MSLLDYEILKSGGKFQVWTPDKSGAVIGVGATEREAKADAVKNMESLCNEFYGEQGEPLYVAERTAPGGPKITKVFRAIGDAPADMFIPGCGMAKSVLKRDFLQECVRSAKRLGLGSYFFQISQEQFDAFVSGQAKELEPDPALQ